MKYFYRARTKQGKMESGIIEASSRESAALLLQKYNVFVTLLEEQSVRTSIWKMKIEPRISNKDLAVFFRQLSVMLASRVPVVQSLQSLALQTVKTNFKEVITKVSESVEEGTPLSDSFSKFPKVFDNFYVNLIRSGETSGNISGALDYISKHLERENDIAGQLRQAMVYPVFVVLVLCVVMVIIITQVMPRIVDLVNEATTAPSFSTKIMLTLYAFVQGYWWALLIVLVVFVGSLLAYLRTARGKEMSSRLILKVPFVGSMLKKVFLARFCGNISTLMSAGISINKALQVTGETVNNIVYEEMIREIEKLVSEGEKISTAMGKFEDYFPPFVVQMIKVGEETGKLDKTLEEVVNFYQKEITRAITLLTSLIEPVMIIFLGGIVALLAISVLSPLYNTLGNL